MNISGKLSFVILSVIATSAEAYIGPGLGAGTVGVILGVLGSILLALFAIFWYPVKRLLRKGKSKPEEIQEAIEVKEEDAVEEDKGPQ